MTATLPIGPEREQRYAAYREHRLRRIESGEATCGHGMLLAGPVCLQCFDTTPASEPEGSPPAATSSAEGNEAGVSQVLKCALCSFETTSERGARAHATRRHAEEVASCSSVDSRTAMRARLYRICFPRRTETPTAPAASPPPPPAEQPRDLVDVQPGEAAGAVTPSEWNTRFVAYSAAHDREPAQQIEHDRDAHPGGCMAGFSLWIGERWRDWQQATGERKECGDAWSPRQHAAFDAWIDITPPRTPADVPPAPTQASGPHSSCGREMTACVGEPAGPQCAAPAGSPAPDPGPVEASPASAGPGGADPVRAFEALAEAAGPEGLAALRDHASLQDQADDPYVTEIVPPADRTTDRTIDERDEAHEWADRLADRIAELTGEDIGEHSNANNPWRRALEAEMPGPAPALLLRGSAMGLGFLCPQSTRSGLRLDLDEEAARLGSAVHEVVAEVLRGQVPDVESARAQAAADHWQLDDAEEVERLAAAAVRQLADLMQILPELASAEVEVAGRAQVPGTEQWITGTADLRTRRGARGFVIDIKSGFREHAHYHQLMTYATQMLTADPALESVQAAVLHVRAGRLGRAIVVTRATAQVWLERVRREVVESEQYRAGPHCTLCPRRFDCAPKRAWVQTITEEALGEGLAVDSLERLAADELIALRGSGVVLRRIGEERVEAVRQYVEQHGDIEGSVSSVVRRVEERREIVPERAIHVLQRVVGRDALLTAMRVRNKELETAVREAAPRGQKKERVAAMWGELESAGAVERSTFTKILEVGHGYEQSR